MDSILNDFQKEVLEVLSKNEFVTENFFFTGGTALSEFYLHHRYSEDFDFFTDQEIKFNTVMSTLQKVFDDLGINTVDYQQEASAKVFFLKKGKRETLKVDFNYFPFKRYVEGTKYNQLQIDSAFDIAVNKLNTLLTRKKARDFIDFYFIQKTRKYNFDNILDCMKRKYEWPVDPLYLASRLLIIEDLHDYPKMIKPFDPKEMLDYFHDLTRSLKLQIVK